MTDLTNRRVEDAAADWMKAKSAETKANKDRIAAEGEILGFISAKTEGGTTHQHSCQTSTCKNKTRA